jgi:hypothetical protein
MLISAYDNSDCIGELGSGGSSGQLRWQALSTAGCSRPTTAAFFASQLQTCTPGGAVSLRYYNSTDCSGPALPNEYNAPPHIEAQCVQDTVTAQHWYKYDCAINAAVVPGTGGGGGDVIPIPPGSGPDDTVIPALGAAHPVARVQTAATLSGVWTLIILVGAAYL